MAVSSCTALVGNSKVRTFAGGWAHLLLRAEGILRAEGNMSMEPGPDGLWLHTSTESATGYQSIKKIRELYYAKVTVEPWPAPQRTLPGKGFNTALEAAIHRARYLAAPYPLPDKREQRPRGKGKVCPCLIAIYHFASCSPAAIVCCVAEADRCRAG